MTVYISELLKEFESIKNKEDRQKLLRQNQSKALNALILYAYNKDKKMKFTSKKIKELLKQDYSVPQEPIDLCPSNLFLEYKRLPYFFEESQSIPEKKLEDFFIIARESLHQDEFEIFLKCLKQNQLCKYMTTNFVEETFPHLLPKKENEGK